MRTEWKGQQSGWSDGVAFRNRSWRQRAMEGHLHEPAILRAAGVPADEKSKAAGLKSHRTLCVFGIVLYVEYVSLIGVYKPLHLQFRVFKTSCDCNDWDDEQPRWMNLSNALVMLCGRQFTTLWAPFNTVAHLKPDLLVSRCTVVPHRRFAGVHYFCHYVLQLRSKIRNDKEVSTTKPLLLACKTTHAPMLSFAYEWGRARFRQSTWTNNTWARLSFLN